MRSRGLSLPEVTARLLAASVLVVVVGTFAWGLVELSTTQSSRPRTVAPSGPNAPPTRVPATTAPLPEVAAARQPVAHARVPGASAPFVVADGALWTASCPDQACRSASGELVATDATTLRSRTTTPIRLAPVGVAASTDGIWVLSEAFNGAPYHLTLVDSTSGDVRFEADVPSQPMGGANPGVH